MSDNKRHSILSPSSADRWIACPPSVRLCAAVKDGATNEYAAEGRLAHRLAEVMLLNALQIRNTGKPLADYDDMLLDVYTSPLYYDEMDDDVAVYVNYVLDLLHQAGSDGRMYVETEVTLFYKTDDVGTVDNMVIDKKTNTLYVTDLKFGKGVLVEARNNMQLLIYAAGAWMSSKVLAQIDNIVMAIVQPRRNHVSTWELRVDEMAAYTARIREAADLALSGGGDFATGEHCRFCKVRARCSALREQARAVVELHECKDPALIDNKGIAALLGQVDLLQEWLSAVKQYAFDSALQGVKFEGYKLVEGTSRRKLTDAKAVLRELVLAGFDKSLLVKQTVAPLTELEKTIGKDTFAEICGRYIEKPDAPPVLADEADPRPEYGIAKAVKDFADFVKN